ncbi:hypothetical protein C0Z16_25125 [Paraburkholderia rhynchosiae]|uniref:Uncharacterized protein n=1 Tax=Paraburkholderia rhynchosiae TaxID=487049 RepID=A0ABX4V023_9BURK|nr:hypothetical protein C0Z16_25125 [Paraburkholderia rhynchosiae]
MLTVGFGSVRDDHQFPKWCCCVHFVSRERGAGRRRLSAFVRDRFRILAGTPFGHHPRRVGARHLQAVHARGACPLPDMRPRAGTNAGDAGDACRSAYDQ